MIIVPPPPPGPIPAFPPPSPVPMPYHTPPPMPPSMRWPTLPAPVDILTFHYEDNMAYAPAAFTYEVRSLSLPLALIPGTFRIYLSSSDLISDSDVWWLCTLQEAINTALELWPQLHAYERERISLLVKGPDQLVRVPKMAWNIVLCDLARYEVVRVQVDELPPPPQYQGDEKVVEKSDSSEKKDENVKPRRSSGLFSSIRRIFWR
jgi:hypothetical protein